MKTAIKFLAFLLIVIIGCGRGKNDGSKVNNKANVVEKPVHNSMDVSEIAEDNFTDDDPFSELIVQYSPQQLQQILGKKEPQDVIDLFLLLPESDFLRYFNFTVEQRKKMIQAIRFNRILAK